MEPIKSADEFQRILDRALKKHEEENLIRVDLGILEDSVREEQETLRRKRGDGREFGSPC